MLVLNMSEVNILYCFDSKFWRMAAVSIGSIMRSRDSSTRVNVYCMVAPHTRGRRRIRRIIGRGGRLIWRQIPPCKNPFRHVDYSRWSPVIFYRLFAHRVFKKLDKILYLDSDTLIYTDLTNLYNTDIRNYALGAIRDMAPVHNKKDPNGKYVREFKENYLKHDLYINSGVLLLNFNYLRIHDQKLLDVKVPLKYPDQDLINVAFDGKILELPLRYNCVPDVRVDIKFPESEFHYVNKKIEIAHFYAVKPYYYHMTPRKTYSMFYHAATAVGFYPEEFVNSDALHAKHKQRNAKRHRTQIPFVRSDDNGNIYFLWMRI